MRANFKEYKAYSINQENNGFKKNRTLYLTGNNLYTYICTVILLGT